MKLNPERLENETFDQYRERRVWENYYSSLSYIAPTHFVQHVNDVKNPNRKWPRRGFRFVTDGSLVQ